MDCTGIVIVISDASRWTAKYSETEMLDRPLMERYILDELKLLRTEQQDLERRLTVQITDRELAVADKSLNYSNITVTYFSTLSLVSLLWLH